MKSLPPSAPPRVGLESWTTPLIALRLLRVSLSGVLMPFPLPLIASPIPSASASGTGFNLFLFLFVSSFSRIFVGLWELVKKRDESWDFYIGGGVFGFDFWLCNSFGISIKGFGFFSPESRWKKRWRIWNLGAWVFMIFFYQESFDFYFFYCLLVYHLLEIAKIW